MEKLKFKILQDVLLNEYLQKTSPDGEHVFNKLTDNPLSANEFSFYTSISAVFSSKIEGEQIELDSFIKHKKLGVKFLPDYTHKIDDLYDAYQFAQIAVLNKYNLKKAHKLLTKHILHPEQRGVTRKVNMFVMTPEGKIEYVACPPEKVETEMAKLYNDIDLLLAAKLTFDETTFFASMIHLVFVKIHPFNDGNGRTARLIEKWFLAQKFGDKAWFMQTEKYYYDNHGQYYTNIRLLGLEYDILDYNQTMPFLLMLKDSLKIQL